MPEYDNTNRGVAFVNDAKESDSHPDMKGSINIEGVEYWLSGWWKTPRNGGEDFLSFSVKPKEAARTPVANPHPVARRGRPHPVAAAPSDDDSDVPF